MFGTMYQVYEGVLVGGSKLKMLSETANLQFCPFAGFDSFRMGGT